MHFAMILDKTASARQVAISAYLSAPNVNEPANKRHEPSLGMPLCIAHINPEA